MQDKSQQVRDALYGIVLDSDERTADRVAAARVFLMDAPPSANLDARENVRQLTAALTGTKTRRAKPKETTTPPPLELIKSGT